MAFNKGIRTMSEETINTVETIETSPIYKQVISDSFGGIMYNVAMRGQYDAAAILYLWGTMSKSEQSSAGGIMNGAINFLNGE